MTFLGAHTASELESLDQIHICLPLNFSHYIELSSRLLFKVQYQGYLEGLIEDRFLGQILTQPVWTAP